ncbi:MAG: hypothetical protein ACRC14_08160 [Paracoccaceae bacterium]
MRRNPVWRLDYDSTASSDQTAELLTMVVSITAISAAVPPERDGIVGIGAQIADSLKEHEAGFRKSFVEGLDPSGDLMRRPGYLREQFQRWDETYTSPEDRAMVDTLKRKVLEMAEVTSQNIRDKVRDNSERLKLELAMKAVSKTTQGIQSLLQSQ